MFIHSLRVDSDEGLLSKLAAAWSFWKTKALKKISKITRENIRIFRLICPDSDNKGIEEVSLGCGCIS